MIILALFGVFLLLLVMMVGGVLSPPGIVILAIAAVAIGVVWHRARERRGRKAL